MITVTLATSTALFLHYSMPVFWLVADVLMFLALFSAWHRETKKMWIGIGVSSALYMVPLVALLFAPADAPLNYPPVFIWLYPWGRAVLTVLVWGVRVLVAKRRAAPVVVPVTPAVQPKAP